MSASSFLWLSWQLEQSVFAPPTNAVPSLHSIGRASHSFFTAGSVLFSLTESCRCATAQPNQAVPKGRLTSVPSG